jgi:hypothetical protein
MSRRIVRALSGVLAALTLVACEQTKSSNPLGPSVAGPIPGVNVTAPTPIEPKDNQRIAVETQPITLVVSNGATTGVRPLSYRFEVATDAGFTNRVFTREGIAPGTSGRTQLRLPEALAPERTYYWRSKAEDGANASDWGALAFFNVYTPVVVGKPIPQEPVNGGTTSTLQPELKWANAPRSGPAGPVVYEIQLSETNTFASNVGVWALDEQAGSTRFTCPVQLGYSNQYYWRVRGFEASTTGPWSDTAAFRTPAQPPPPGGGGGGGGASCAANANLHVSPGGLTEDKARQVTMATADEFPCHLATFGSEGEALDNAEALLRRIIWHLEKYGFQADRQRNPSGLISKDKLTVNISGSWRAFDIFTLGYAGVATRMTWGEVFPADHIADSGIPD